MSETLKDKIVHWGKLGCGKVIIEWQDENGVKFVNVKTLRTTYSKPRVVQIPLSKITSIEN
jgi:hypothetical protein